MIRKSSVQYYSMYIWFHMLYEYALSQSDSPKSDIEKA